MSTKAPRPTATKGMSYTTGMVHLVSDWQWGDKGQLIQACGISRRQLCYLQEMPEDTTVTCKRCAAKA